MTVGKDIMSGVAGGVGGVPGGAPEAGKPLGTAKTSSVERFNDLMDAGQKGETAPVDAENTPDAVSVTDRIMQGVNDVNVKLDKSQAEVARVFQKEDATQMDLIKANFAMLESSTLISAASKVTEKITQGVKTLQQG